MSNAFIKTVEKPKISLKTQVLATITAIVAAVALPQLFHAIGALSGTGTATGEIFLPMHLPVILVGLLAGPYVGAVAGLASPMVSYLLSGMPGMVMLPFMMIELMMYGLFGGLLRKVKLPVIAKVFSIQVAGRAIRALAILVAVYVLGNAKLSVAVIWNSIVTGLPGIILQLALIPMAVHWVEKHEQ